MYGENAILNHMKRIFGGGRVKSIQYREGGLFSNIFAHQVHRQIFCRERVVEKALT